MTRAVDAMKRSANAADIMNTALPVLHRPPAWMGVLSVHYDEHLARLSQEPRQGGATFPRLVSLALESGFIELGESSREREPTLAGPPLFSSPN